MKIDALLHTKNLRLVSVEATRAEAAGHDTVWVSEAGTDAFLHAYAVSVSTTRAGTGTAIAVAFARSPMIVAQLAWELADVAAGRFTLGLGTQVKAHIERRYSMPWGEPVPQMREYLEALAAIWEAWRAGTPLHHEGAYYTHTLMTPFFVPESHDRPIPVWLASVGPSMAELAGELCDGVMLHPFSNRVYDETVVQGAFEAGVAKSGRSSSAVEVSRPLVMVMGDTDEEIEARRRLACRQLAFYGSTPNYRSVLDAVGFGDLQLDLAELARRKEWEQMAALFDGEIFDHFAIVGRPEEMPERARNHLGDFITRTSSYFGWPVEDPDRLRAILSAFHQAPVTADGTDG